MAAEHEELQKLERKREALIAHQDTAIGRSDAIMAHADRERRDLTAVERERVVRNTESVEQAEEELQALNREVTALERAAVVPMARRTSVESSMSLSGDLNGLPHRLAGPPIPASARFADLFGRAPDPYGGKFASLAEFCTAVATGGHDARLIRNATMSEQLGTGGGFLVPTPYLSEILDAALQAEIVRPRARVFPMESNQLTLAGFDGQDRTGGASAGLVLKWANESETLAEQTGKTRAITLKAKKGSIYVRVSNELADDVIAFDRQLRTEMTNATASGLDYAFFQGNGVGQPLGVLSAPATIVVAKEGSQAANTILLQNLAKMLARLRPDSYARAAWFVHPTTLPVLYQMTVVIRNVAGTENVGGGSAAVTFGADGNLRIFGLPVVVTDACAPLSSKGDVVLADWSAYLVGLRSDAVIASSDARYFDTDETAFRLILRVDGAPIQSAPIKLRDGANTVSGFVTLEAR